mmetsp:Transcript_57634/g.125365  ORF Transcript_57634/g.125365 Transcript_57634/m.125365 type:complete len:462 (+) Transcript_57634:20-1405(+)
MKSAIATLGAALLAASASATDYPEPPQILDPSVGTTWVGSSLSSRKALVDVPFVDQNGEADNVHCYRLDLVGSIHDRGFAQGAMMAKEILEFVDVKLNQYYISMVMDINVNLDGLPEPLQKMFHALKVKGAAHAPEVFNEALEWVYNKELQYMPKDLIEEMEAIGEGICSTMGPNCSVEDMQMLVKRVNMLPELIRMACTAFGAWGPASATGKLVQVRALDFGSGPFGNYTVLQVHRPTDARAFASISFPGMVGVVTGVAQDGIGLSEKVWMDYDKYSLQPGSYEGEPDVFVMRDVLEHTKTREEAEAYMESAHRTWGIWLGIGDFETQVMDIVGYQQASSIPYTDVTMPSNTEMPYMENLVYVDKHPQPSHDGVNGTLPTALGDFYGDMSVENARVVVQYHETGDAHIAMYDYGASKLVFSIGRINENGDYGPVDGDLSAWKSYNRPYLSYDMNDLWSGN